MTEVYVSGGTSALVYHTSRECYHAQKADKLLPKPLDLIQVHYRKCSVCDEWENENAKA